MDRAFPIPFLLFPFHSSTSSSSLTHTHTLAHSRARLMWRVAGIDVVRTMTRRATSLWRTSAGALWGFLPHARITRGFTMHLISSWQTTRKFVNKMVRHDTSDRAWNHLSFHQFTSPPNLLLLLDSFQNWTFTFIISQGKARQGKARQSGVLIPIPLICCSFGAKQLLNRRHRMRVRQAKSKGAAWATDLHWLRH